jgi:hypothetical protein
VPKVQKGAADACIAPSRILTSDSNDELLDTPSDRRPAEPAPGAAIVLGGHKRPIPAQQCVGSHNRPEFSQNTSRQAPSSPSEPPALLIAEPRPSITELLPQDVILFAEIGDDIGLLAVEPAGHHQSDEEDGVEGRAAGHAMMMA